MRLFSLDPDPVAPAFPVAVVAGPDSQAALGSLLRGARLHASVDEGVDWVSSQVAEYRRLDELYEEKLKMYILVQEDLAPGQAMVAAAHAAVACVERFSQCWELRCWLYGRFNKVAYHHRPRAAAPRRRVSLAGSLRPPVGPADALSRWGQPGPRLAAGEATRAFPEVSGSRHLSDKSQHLAKYTFKV